MLTMRFVVYAAGVALLVCSVQAVPAASVVPEIDGATMVSGLGLLAGGLMVLRARLRR
jgi:hypothetical protein